MTFDISGIRNFVLHRSGFGYRAEYTVNVDLRGGRMLVSLPDEGDVLIEFGKEDCDRITSGLERSRLFDGKVEPAQICDGTWYEMMVFGHVHRTIRWNCGTEGVDSSFVDALDEIMGDVYTRTDGIVLPDRFCLHATSGQNDLFPEMYSINLVTGRCRGRVCGQLRYVTLDFDTLLWIRRLLKESRILDTDPEYILAFGSTYYDIELTYGCRKTKKSWNTLNEEIDAEPLRETLYEIFRP